MVTDIQINTNNTENSYTYSGYNIEVTEVNPWDQLSKAFKKYVHTIQYTGGRYEQSKYNVSLYHKGKGTYKFRYSKPELSVDKLELYFKGTDDINSAEPLVVGFINVGWRDGDSRGSKGCPTIDGRTGSKCYYTWKSLTGTRTGSLDTENAIREKDLITVLLEELGAGTRIRPNRHVIRLDERHDGVSTYPGSGHNKNNKITVRKGGSEVSGVPATPAYDKYVHTIPSDQRVEEFYVTYGNDSMYFETGLGLGYLFLSNVAVYYKTGTGGTGKPVLFTFSFRGKGTYVYTYYDFVSDFKTLRGGSRSLSEAKKIIDLKRIGSGGVYQDSELQSQLTEESNKIKQITFEKGSDGIGGNVTIDGPSEIRSHGAYKEHEKFKKVTFKPKTSDLGEGSSGGPWVLNSGQLFTKDGKGEKIDKDATITPAGVLDRLTKSKYQCITVYYTSNDKAFLVEFDEYGSKTYIKRTNAKGTQWAFADGVNIDTRGGDERLLAILQRESEILRRLISLERGDPGGSGHENITTSEPQDFGLGKGKEKFKKVTLTPNTTDGSGGSSVGPWTVYSGKLITLEKGVKIPDEVLDSNSIVTTSVDSSFSSKYSSITVYYSTKGGGSSSDSSSKYRALLVEFAKVGGSSTGDNRGTSSTNGIRGNNETKIYFRRVHHDGSKWAVANDISSRIGTGAGSDRALLHVLQKESKGLRPMIEFVKGDGHDSTGNEHITTTGLQDVGQDTVGRGITFQKVTMTPDTGVGGSADGPWKVYNSQLIIHEQRVKIDDYVLDDIFSTDDVGSSTSNKYRSITVYYAVTGDDEYSALLVEFARGTNRIGAGGCADKIYLRRENKDGTFWDGESGINTGDTRELAQKLTEIGIDANIIEVDSSSSDSTPVGSDSEEEHESYIDGDDEVNGTGNLIDDLAVGSIEDEVVEDDEGDNTSSHMATSSSEGQEPAASSQEATVDTLIKTGGGVAGGIGVAGAGLLLYKNFGSLVGLLKR